MNGNQNRGEEYHRLRPSNMNVFYGRDSAAKQQQGG